MALLTKLHYDMELMYQNKCVISGNNNVYDLQVQPIVPFNIMELVNPNIKFTKYNYLVMTKQLASDFVNYKFTIYPEPIFVTYTKLPNDKFVRAGEFRVLPHPNYGINELKVNLPCSCAPFLKWHFIKFFEVNNFNPNIWNIKYTISSDAYLYNFIYKIGNINTDYVKDKNNDVMFNDVIEKMTL